MPFTSTFARNIYENRYMHEDEKSWGETAERVASNVMAAVGYENTAEREEIQQLIAERKLVPGGRYLYASGRDLHQVNNCVLLRCPDNREGWATTSYQAEMSLMTGAGIGVWYGDVRPSGTLIKKTGGIASGPIAKMQQINDTGRHIMQGGQRRSAIWAGLPWWHGDIFDFITSKDWNDTIKALKADDWTFPAAMDMTNISVTLDDEFFIAYNGDNTEDFSVNGNLQAPDGSTWNEWATRVYNEAVAHMLRHGEPGFSVDVGDKRGEVLRNACTEITSADDSDVCNLGSICMARFDTVEEFERAVKMSVLFLTAGSEYSDTPYEKIKEVRNKNRRLGLGLLGVHEFVMKNGVKYGTEEAEDFLRPWMEAYDRALAYAHEWQDELGLSHSKGATAIAPNGTIGIIAETTPSADPLFSAAEIRQVKIAGARGDTFEEHVVVDPTAARLVEEGVDPANIEDAYSLATEPERRLRQQAFLQDYTDHAISSTVNLPKVITDPDEVNEFKDLLMKYLPRLRGITVYPDGARAGQPRTAVDLQWALENEGVKLAGTEESCGLTGACGV